MGMLKKLASMFKSFIGMLKQQSHELSNLNRLSQPNNSSNILISPSLEDKRLRNLEKEFYRYNLEASKNIEPLEFWRINKHIYPIIYEAFIRIFCTPATSVPSEQLFSSAGYSIWDRLK
ncbi:zinc finger BED domain-containing 1-like [Brachionus plicatilis]|uniref:Zinc finger BED domain-containing 1-like n=1 Tax=Brachionus plicatilis TaxID=10195 RepID=A0A3M7QGW5_BRAPC|nr:zinc finger BED domain-containing 1-like [Brachionus plicatilis]